ncbi:MAG: FHA domain-containing protein [Spirochaetales bacterium]|nr:FHA domain-containing protein [Spirochaetales bacterium]
MSDNIQIPPNVSLEVIKGDDMGKSFTINEKTMTIGRSNICDIQLHDGYISNKHCQIVFRGGHFTIIDLGSLNKTKVNGSKYVQKNLLNEDIIRIGKTELQFLWSEIDESTINQDEDILVPETDSAMESDE